jgi:hypothetical protein
MINIHTGATKLITDKQFSSISYDSRSRAALLYMPDYQLCNPPGFQGVYRWELDGDGLEQVRQADDQVRLHPGQPGWILIGDEDFYEYSPAGERVWAGEMPSSFCDFKFGLDALAWTSSPYAVGNPYATGMWITPYGKAAQLIYPQQVPMMFWSGDGATLYFVGENGRRLYSATGPDYTPRLRGSIPTIRSAHSAGVATARPGCG